MGFYSYDPTGQLTGASHSTNTNANEGYVYDSSGNRLSTGSQTSKNIVAPSNRITADANFTYGYDDEGNLNLKTETATGKKWKFLYDYLNRLTSATQLDANNNVLSAITYNYDLIGRRIAKTVNSATTQFFYQGDNIWRQVDASNNTTHYLTGGAKDQWIARNTTSGTNWYLTDRLGSVTGITDATGKLINSTTYDSFGHITGQSNPAAADQLAFTGREFDAETGLYYFRARYYNPDLGRFQSEDPIEFNSNDFNLARYCLNSPTGFIDSTGKDPLDEEAQTQSYLFRGTAEGYGGRQGVSFTSTSPLVSYYYAVFSETTEFARGIIYVLDRAQYAEEVLESPYSLAEDYEVVLDVAPDELSSITSLSAQEGRVLLQELGVPAENLPTRIENLSQLRDYLDEAQKLDKLFTQDILDKFVAGALQ